MARQQLTDLLIQRLQPPAKGQRTVFDTVLRGFGVRLSQGGSKSFIVVKGSNRRLHTIGRYPDIALKDARRLAQALLAQKTSLPTDGRPTPFPEARSAYLAAKKRKLKATSMRNYTMYLNFFDWTKAVDKITRLDVQRKLADLDGKDTAQNLAFQYLRTFFRWCVKEELITHSPITGMTPPNKLKSRSRVLTDDELKKIWDATDYPYGRLVRVLMLTGARRNEISRYGLEGTHLRFHDTKNNHSHQLPVTPLVKEQLPVTPIKDWAKEKQKLDKRCGVKDWVLHDLRRTFSTNCARLRVPIHVTERILNHLQGSLSAVALIYNKWQYEEEIAEALLTHEAFILKIIKPASTPVVATTSIEDRSNETAKQTSGLREAGNL